MYSGWRAWTGQLQGWCRLHDNCANLRKRNLRGRGKGCPFAILLPQWLQYSRLSLLINHTINDHLVMTLILEYFNRYDWHSIQLCHTLRCFFLMNSKGKIIKLTPFVIRDGIHVSIDSCFFKKPISDMMHGLEVVRILSLAQESLRKGEKPVYYK